MWYEMKMKMEHQQLGRYKCRPHIQGCEKWEVQTEKGKMLQKKNRENKCINYIECFSLSTKEDHTTKKQVKQEKKKFNRRPK